MSSFLRSLKNAAAAASDALLGRGTGGTGGPAKPRPACQYGAKCYRKNPQHRIDESHPGDDDHGVQGDGGRTRRAAAASAVDEQKDATAPAEEEEPAAAPRLKKAPSRRRGAAAAAAASEPAAPATPSSAAESNTVACASSSATDSSSAPAPAPQLSPTSCSSSVGSSPRVEKKMSVRDRRRRAQLEAAATPSPVSSPPPPDEAAAAAPASLPPLPVPAASAVASSSSSSASHSSPVDELLLASLHALHHTPSSLIPEFIELRESRSQALANRGAFYVGRAPSGTGADGTPVPLVHLQLQSRTPRLAKMISRVHARITWERTPVLTHDQEQRQRAGTRGLIKKRRPGQPSGEEGEEDEPQAYTYKFFIEDEGSVNGLFVNSIKQPSRGPALHLSRGDKIVFGGGAGRAAGEWLAQKAQDAEYAFEFNCVERVPELKASTAGAAGAKDGSDEERGSARRAGTATSLRKRVHSVAVAAAAATAAAAAAAPPSHALKRRKSEEEEEEGNQDATQEQPPHAATLDRPVSNVDMAEEDDGDEEERDDAVSEAASEDGTAAASATSDADAGATQNFGDMATDDCAHMDATQDYVDQERDDQRTEAAGQATQDFGGGDLVDDDGGAGATQDAGGMFE